MPQTKLAQAKEILKIAIPSGLSSFLDILNISITLFFVSKLSTLHIVAFGAGTNFLMLFYTITAIFSTGTNAIIARLYKSSPSSIPQSLSTLTFGALLSSFPLFILAFFLYSPYLQWLGLNGDSLSLAQDYLQIVIYTLPALLLRITLTSAFSAISKANIPFFIKLICTCLNLITTYALTFGFGFIPALGIQGAGIASLITGSLEAFLLLLGGFKLLGFKPTLNFSTLKLAFKIGLPTGLERSFTLFSFVLVSKFILSYGEDILAGFQIGGRIEAFAFMPGFGFMIASMSLMGQNISNLTLAKSYTHLNLLIASVFMGTLGIIMCLFGKEFARIFSQDEEVLNYALYYLYAVGLSQIPLIFIFVLDGALRGAGTTKFSLYINTLSIWGLRIIPMYICTFFSLSYYYIFIIIFLETYIRAGIFWLIFSKGYWQKRIINVPISK